MPTIIETLIEKYKKITYFEGIGRFDRKVLEQEGLNHRQVYEDWERDAKDKLTKLDSFKEENYKIPALEHTVFLTSDTNPKELKSEYLEKMIASSKRLLAEDHNFQPILWTNNLELNNLESVKELKKQLPKLQVRSVSEFADHPLYEHLQKLLAQGQDDYRFFVEASDIARIMIEQRHGGIYHDLDYEIFVAQAITNYMKSFDYFNGREEHHRWDSFTGNAFIAAKPNHPVINKASVLIKRNLDKGTDAPEYIHYPLNKFDSVICSTGPAMLNVAYHLEGNKDGNIDMIFPGNVIYNADFARKKSKDLENTPVTNWNGINVKTVGGDLFQGKWGDEYLKNIRYFMKSTDNAENKKILKVLNDLKKGDFSSYKEYTERESDQQKLTDMSLLGITLGDKSIYQIDLYKALHDAIDIGQTEIANTLKLMDTSHFEQALKIAERISDEKYLGSIAEKLIDKGHLEQGLHIAERISGEDYLDPIAAKLIDKGNLEQALKIAERISDEDYLGLIAEKLIDKNYFEQGIKLAERISDEDYLDPIAAKLIEKNHTEQALKIAERISDERYLGSIAEKLIDKDNLEQALKIAERISDERYLGSIAKKIIDKGHIEQALKIAERISDNRYLGSIAEKLIDKDNLEQALKIAERISDEYYLGSIAKRLTKKDHFEQALKIVNRISDDEYLNFVVTKLLDKVHVEQAINIANRIPNQKNNIQASLDEAFNIAFARRNFEMVSKLLPFTSQNTLTIGALRTLKTLSQFNPISIASGLFSGANNLLQQYDPIRLFSGAQAAEVNNEIPQTPLPDMGTQIALGMVLHKMGKDGYEAVQNYINKLPNPIAAPEELASKNDRLYKRIQDLHNIPKMLEELSTKAVDKKKSKEFTEQFTSIAEAAKKLNEAYFAIENPIDKKEFKKLYDQAKELHILFIKTTEKAVAALPELAPKANNLPKSVLKQVDTLDLPQLALPKSGLQNLPFSKAPLLKGK